MPWAWARLARYQSVVLLELGAASPFKARMSAGMNSGSSADRNISRTLRASVIVALQAGLVTTRKNPSSVNGQTASFFPAAHARVFEWSACSFQSRATIVETSSRYFTENPPGLFG